MEFISQDIPAVKDMNAVASLGMGTSTNLLIEAQDVTDPPILEWMLQIEQRVEEEQSDIVVGTNSIADVVLQATDGHIRQSSQQVRQILAVVQPQVRRNLITDDFTAANIIVSNQGLQTDASTGLAEALRGYASKRPNGVDVTVIGGFAALLIATDFPILRNFGPITLLDVFFAAVTTLVVLPPLIVWLDSWREKHGRSEAPAAST
jgi:predicted RND superfamily exporter protein